MSKQEQKDKRSALKNPVGKSMIEYRRFLDVRADGVTGYGGEGVLKIRQIRDETSIPYLFRPLVEEKNEVLGDLSGARFTLSRKTSPWMIQY